jgi:methionyl-tRNA formyltransferase
MSLRIVFAGTPIFAEKALDALFNQAINVVAVYTQPDRPAGRGMKLVASPVKLLAEKHGVAVKQPLTLRDAIAQAELAALKPDLMIVAAYGLILPQAVLDIPRLGCLNIHASLLPRWRGAAPIHRAILAGDRETGVAIMRMEAGLDTGAVLLEKRTPIHATDTTQSLHDRLAALGAEAMLEAIDAFARGAPPKEIPQPSEGVTYANKITSDEAIIDWTKSVDEVERVIRAFNPAPGAVTFLRGERVKIWRARIDVAPESASSQPLAAGNIIRVDRKQLCVACGDSGGAVRRVLWLEEIQRAGGKRMPIAAWLATENSPQHGETFNSTPNP